MKFLILAACVAYAAASSADENAQIIRSDFQQSPDGNFQYNYETDNGISGQASGALKQVGKDEAAVVVSGANQYTSPEGQIIELTYVADENGYQPQGAHLPTTPAPEPIPEYIARALEYIAAHPYKEEKKI